MKHRDAAWAAAGLVLLLLGAWLVHSGGVTSTNLTVEAGQCHMPATVIEPRSGATERAAIIIHGLSANRRVMRLLGETLATEDHLRAYLIDLPGHGDNTEAFSFSRAEECARAAVEKLVRDETIAPAQTVLVGHSMGGAIAIRLADVAPVAATVAISPAPMVLPRRIPSNLIVFSAQFDFQPLRQQARALAHAAGGDRTSVEDFAQRRAFHLEDAGWANHTSVLVDPKLAEQAASWIEAALDPAALSRTGAQGWTDNVDWGSGTSPRGWHPKMRIATAWTARIAPVVGFVGLLLIFPFALSVAAGAGRLTHEPGVMSEFHAINKTVVLVEGAALAFVAVLLLKAGVPLKFLQMYSGAYLASLLAIFGLLLLALNGRAARESWVWKPRGFVAGCGLGFAVMLACGSWLNWTLVDVWLNGARWMRFAALLPFCFLFIFGEEVVLGSVGRGHQRLARFFIFLLLRLELWFAAVVAYYALVSGNVLIGVLVPALATFSVLQRLGTDEIRTRTGSPVAAACFGAILAAWLIAAIFPLT